MSVLLEDRLREHDGLLVTSGTPDSAYARRWEAEASTDHVRSAIAVSTDGADDLATLTAKVNPLWERFPDDRHVDTLLDIGPGYGRIELWLSSRKGLRCDTFCAVDISPAMLRRLVEYRERHDAFPGATIYPIQASADSLPIADGSVDLVVSSAVFLHMGKAYVARTLREVARVLKPGGDFVFDTSFPNALNPWSFAPRLKPRRSRAPHALKYWRAQEVRTLIQQTGLAARAGSFRVEGTTFGLVPKEVGPVAVPFAEAVNARLADPKRFRSLLTVTFHAYSDGALT